MSNTVIILLVFCFQFNLLAQCLKDSDRLRIEIGPGYAPTIVIQPRPRFVMETISPNLEVSLGVSNFNVYASLGRTIELGVKAGNEFLIAGISYNYNGFAIEDLTHSVFFEIGYHTRHFKGSRFSLELTTKHGFTFDSQLYVFAPLNICLKYLLIGKNYK